MTFRARFLRAILWTAAALCISGPVIAQDVAQTSEEGLELVETSDSSVLYVKPGLKLADFQKLILLDAFVSIDEDWLRGHNRQVMRTRRIREADVEDITERVRLDFWDVFGGLLFADGYFKEVAAVEEGALILRPAIIDVSVSSHDPSSDAIVQNFDSEASGAMTLVLEIYNATNSELVARLFSKERIGGVPDFTVESSSANRADEHAVYKNWVTSVTTQFKSH